MVGERVPQLRSTNTKSNLSFPPEPHPRNTEEATISRPQCTPRLIKRQQL
ncbi:UNVERIFIED_CONTAM: hypothetical protein FKN15_012223 [Acipenser sinensis]